jgi:hypothetical protein
MSSEVGEFLRNLAGAVTASVYMDDIAVSSDDQVLLQEAFDALREVAAQSNFVLNAEKTRAPAEVIELFNCNLFHHVTAVREERRALFYEEPRNDASQLAFERYCDRIEEGNAG